MIRQKRGNVSWFDLDPRRCQEHRAFARLGMAAKGGGGRRLGYDIIIAAVHSNRASQISLSELLVARTSLGVVTTIHVC